MTDTIVPQRDGRTASIVLTIDRSPWSRAHLLDMQENEDAYDALYVAPRDARERDALRLARRALLHRADQHFDALRAAGCLLHCWRA